jgi:hypothetical protein
VRKCVEDADAFLFGQCVMSRADFLCIPDWPVDPAIDYMKQSLGPYWSKKTSRFVCHIINFETTYMEPESSSSLFTFA